MLSLGLFADVTYCNIGVIYGQNKELKAIRCKVVNQTADDAAELSDDAFDADYAASAVLAL